MMNEWQEGRREGREKRKKRKGKDRCQRRQKRRKERRSLTISNLFFDAQNPSKRVEAPSLS